MKQLFRKFKKSANSDSEEKYMYDIFISYRRKPSKDAIHSTSLAMLLALELRNYGYKVYVDVDCWDKTYWRDALKISRQFIVLLTAYSFDEENGSQNGKDDEKGNAFRDEVNDILKKLDNGKLKKNQVYWINVDDSFNPYENGWGEKIRETGIKIRKLDTGRELLLDSINSTADPVFPRIPQKQSKKISVWVTVAMAVLAVIALVWCGRYYDDKLVQYSDSLAQYKEPGILFIGGQSGKRHLDSFYNVDVGNYTPVPNSIYVHLGSTSAAGILLEDINDSIAYHPVVLSAGVINTFDDDTLIAGRFMDYNRRILQYWLGDVPLLVQLRNYKDSTYKTGDTISIDTLKRLLRDATHKYTTSPSSGTIREYEKILGISLKDEGSRRLNKYEEFSLDKYGRENKKDKQIYLANEAFAIQEDGIVSLKIQDGSEIEKIGMFLYTVGEWDINKDKYMPRTPVKEFIDSLKLSIDEDKYGKTDSLVIIL